MSAVLPAVEPAGPARTSGLAAIFEHTRYVLGENRVTAFAFGLLVVILFAAIFGPYIVPYDPLASDTAAALKPPSAAHWFGTDQLGRDIFSRVIVATRLDTFIAVRLGGAGVPDGRARRHRRRLFRRLDRPHRRPHRRHHHGVSAVRAGDGHRRGARQHRAEHHHRDRDRELSALCPRRPRRGQSSAATPVSCRRRGCRAMASSGFCWCTSCPTSCRS